MNSLRDRYRGAAVLFALFLSVAPSGASSAGPADSYVQSAHRLEKESNFRGAIIQLRNAAQAEPSNGAVHLELAQLYLKLGDPNAAEAELFSAHLRGMSIAVTDPPMAEAMLQMGQFGDLLKKIPAGRRPAKSEAAVRTYRGVAELALNDLHAAAAMFSQAERLDPKSPLPLVGEARLLMVGRQYVAAQKKAEQALKFDPNNSDASDARALALAAQGNTGDAIKQLDAAISVSPQNARLILDHANLEIRQGRLDLARKDLERARSIAPGSVGVLLLQAVLDAQAGKYREADTAFERLRSVMAVYPPVYLIAAEVKYNLKQFGQAEGFLKKYVAQGGDNPKAYELLGAIALKRGDAEGAVGLLERSIRVAPNNVSAMALLGEAYVATGELEKAKLIFGQAAAKAPGNRALIAERALADIASGDSEAGLSELEVAFNAGKGTLAAGPPLALEAMRIGRLDEADRTVQQLVQRDPANVTYRELRAAVKVAEQDFPAAESELRALLARDSNLASARRDLAQLYLRTNRAAAAKRLYEERLAGDPRNVEAMEALAGIAFRQKNDAEAIRWLTEAQRRAVNDPRPGLAMIGLLEVRKKWPDAIGRARALKTKFPNDPAVADALAHLYFASGNRAESLAAYQSAAAKFPDSVPILTHLAAIFAGNKDYAHAADVLARAVRLERRDIGLKKSLVTLVYLAKGADAALAASQSVFSDRTTAALVTADVLDANNNRPAAMTLLSRYQLQGTDGRSLVRLAVLYQRDGRSAKALSLLEPWSKSHPNDFQARFTLAMLYSGTGNLDRARDEYEDLAKQRPENAIVLNNLAWIYWVKKDSRARGTAERAVKCAPHSGSAADTLGWILLNQGDVAGALKFLGQASKSLPKNPTIQYHFAVALSKSGKPEQARSVLQKVMAMNVPPGIRSPAQSLLSQLPAKH